MSARGRLPGLPRPQADGEAATTRDRGPRPFSSPWFEPLAFKICCADRPLTGTPARVSRNRREARLGPRIDEGRACRARAGQREVPLERAPERAPLGLLVISPYYRWCGKRSLKSLFPRGPTKLPEFVAGRPSAPPPQPESTPTAGVRSRTRRMGFAERNWFVRNGFMLEATASAPSRGARLRSEERAAPGASRLLRPSGHGSVLFDLGLPHGSMRQEGPSR